jgi:hypothetical protein
MIPNATEVLSQMKIKVTVGEFHSTHDKALAAQKIVQTSDLSTIPGQRLIILKGKLAAGQRLTDAEDGPDFMYATSYKDEITLIDKELQRRLSE